MPLRASVRKKFRSIDLRNGCQLLNARNGVGHQWHVASQSFLHKEIHSALDVNRALCL